MDAVVIIQDPRGRKRSRQSGFSMIEMLLTAFILAVGVLGLTMLQVMSMRASTGGRSLNTAVMVGEGVLESIQSEGRQRLLILKNSGAAPGVAFYPAVRTEYYAFDGSVVANAADAFYTVAITPSDVVNLSTAGGTKHFTVVVTFSDTPNPANPAATVPRTVTLSRQVAYA